MTKKYLYFVAFLFVFSLIFPYPSLAQGTSQSQSITDLVLADVMRLAPEVKITEPISRDALLVGGSVEVAAPVAGDLILAGGEVAVKAEVAGDVRVLAGRVTLDSKIGGNVTVIGGEVLFDKNSNISGNVYVASARALLDGRVGGSVMARVDEGRNFRVSHTAQINGSLSYRAQSENDNLGQNAARGGVVFEPVKKPQAVGKIVNIFSLLSLFGLLVVGLLFVSLAPRSLRQLIDTSLRGPTKDLLWGVITLLATPLVILFLALTLIGLPLALILLIGYVLIIYLSSVFSGLGLGIYLARLAKGREWSEKTSLVLLMVVGMIILWALIRVPVVGSLIQLGSIIWGLGLIVRLKWQVIKRIESN